MPSVVKLLCVAGFACVLSFMTAPVSAKDITFGYVAAGMQFPFNVAVVNSFEDAAREAGVKAIILDGKTSVEWQGNAIDDLIAQKVDGVAGLPIDGLVAQDWVDRVTAHSIPFVSIATEIACRLALTVACIALAGVLLVIPATHAQIDHAQSVRRP
ncbi:sugar ABC transporter substrate-binding protein [Paraburkholderia rhynchosiae]|uniref:Periplasmic binding protein domain-containing protein n=1 Tax=Paraburkholderia rhynchosiae TaxID=487049 RepID=A0A6J5CTN8_9BURK|nr:substrate-binding domain-containing protein [Paraburkholderia rhynchosiae]CAB3745160.1 hypothetical protein LMG27174_07301 [Paraburkholderia rhynchosiae]